MATIPTSLWDQHNVTALVRHILATVPAESRHGTGRPFLTAYQIAIEFDRQFPVVTAALGQALGGQGQGPFALTTYLARWLPDRIYIRGITDIELGFLSPLHMTRLEFLSGEATMTATTHQAGFATTMFRLIDEND
jgi:hypothetical protein